MNRILNNIVLGVIVGLLALGFIYFLFIIATGQQINTKNNYNTVIKEDIKLPDTPNVEVVRNLIKELDIKYPDICLAQSILETGWYKSNVCKKYNNLFGFRSKRGYILYESWQQSLQGYQTWQTRYYTGEEDYYAFLERINYAEDTNYVVTLKQIVAQIE